MRFNNANEVAKYYQGLVDSGKGDKLKADLGASGEGIPLVTAAELSAAADALKNYLVKYLERYYASYSPEVYERTGQLLDSVNIEMTESDGKMQARVFFDSSMTTGASVFGGASGDKVALIDKGWAVGADNWFADIYRFGHFDGVGFIASAIGDAQSDPRFENIEISYSGGA